jgi:hypothetical protein
MKDEPEPALMRNNTPRVLQMPRKEASPSHRLHVVRMVFQAYGMYVVKVEYENA